MSRYDEIVKERNINYKKIVQRYESLGVPKDFYFVPNFEDTALYVGVSDRRMHKTTNALLFGLCAYDLFGYTIAYCKTDVESARGTDLESLFDTITQFGYINTLTNGLYNTVKYNRIARTFTLYNSDTDALDNKPFMKILIVDKYLTYTSSLDLPFCNIVIYDEFIGTYKPDTFIHFMSILSTVLRYREKAYIMLLGNTLDKNNPWFDELGLRSVMPKMRKGSCRLVETDRGTVIRFQLFGELAKNSALGELKNVINKLYFGFNNPKMSTIRGDGETWAGYNYPSIRYNDDDKILSKNYKIKYHSVYFTLQLVYSVERGLHIDIKPYNETLKDNHIIIVSGTPDNKQEMNFARLPDKILDIFNDRRVYYSDSYTYMDIQSFLMEVRQS